MTCYVIKLMNGYTACQTTRVTSLAFCDRFDTEAEALEHLYFYADKEKTWEFEVIKIGEVHYD